MTSVPSEGEPVAKQECIRYEISDLHSISRSKTVPARHKGKSVYLPCGLVGLGPYCTAMANHGITLLPESVGDGYGNTLLEPDWSTLTTVPFASTDEYVTRRVICNQPGQPLPRQLCQEQLRKLDEAGYQFFSAHELEFTLLKPGPEAGDKIPDGGDVEAWVTAFKGIDYTSTIQTAKSEQFIMKVERDMDAMGVDIQTMNAEYGEGQMEITYGPKYGIEGPDASFTFKNGVKEIAMKSGLHATFMTKPLDDYGCNGGHTNFSLWTKDGKNAFYDEESGGKELSAIGKHWVAGVLKHGLAMQAIGAPTVSCYNRFKDWSWSPTSLCWGYENRTVALRVKLGGKPESTYMEWRLPSACGNNYMVVAGLIAAGLEGIESKLEPPEPIMGDAYTPENTAKHVAVAKTLPEALENLENDTEFSAQMTVPGSPYNFTQSFLTIKREEVFGLTAANGGDEHSTEPDLTAMDEKTLHKWCRARYQPLI